MTPLTREPEPEGMSADMIEEFRDAFELFDKDGDGFVTAVELGTVMRSLGLEPTDEELDDLVREIDEDGKVACRFLMHLIKHI